MKRLIGKGLFLGMITAALIGMTSCNEKTTAAIINRKDGMIELVKSGV